MHKKDWRMQRLLQCLTRKARAGKPRVSGNYLPGTLPLALQGPSKIAQGNALGTVRARGNQAL